jgi:hypothetical protein
MRPGNSPRKIRAVTILPLLLIKAQIGGPLSGANRKTFTHVETYQF